MNKITIKTGTTRIDEHLETGDQQKSDLVHTSAEPDKNFTELTLSSKSASLQNETSSSETFHAISINNFEKSPDCSSHEPDSEDGAQINVSNDDASCLDSTILARFVPKATENECNHSESSSKMFPSNEIEKDINILELQKDVTKQTYSEIIPKEVTSVASAEFIQPSDDSSNRNIETHQHQISNNSETTESEVTTVIGSGHAPENDPDHSMLRFAVYEVQDLTEELKKLRDLLDHVIEPSFFRNGDDFDESNPLIESFNNASDQSIVYYSDNSDFTLIGNTAQGTISPESNIPIAEVVTNGCRKSDGMHCNHQSEASYYEASRIGCEDYKDASLDRCSFNNFTQEITTAVN